MSRVAAASANDEEHRLIARYAARLAQENRAVGVLIRLGI